MPPPGLDRFRGCLLGGAIGDALGYPIEFITTEAIERAHGRDAPASLSFAGGAPARISDDTQMTLFTAEGLIRATRRERAGHGRDPNTVTALALLRWYRTQGGQPIERGDEPGWLVAEPALHARRAPGNTCMAALHALGAARVLALPTVETPPNDSKGCGAVMRVAPCGLVAATRALAYELARDNGVITHGHPSGYLSAAYLAAAIWDLARGASLPEAMGHADALLAPEPDGDEMRACVAQARQLAAHGPPTPAAIEELGGGWVGEEALAIALLCALTHDPAEPRGLERTLWRAVAHSGDSDSTGAITGNLLGASLGVGALPAAWLEVLELRDVIDRIATDLYAAATDGAIDPSYPAS